MANEDTESMTFEESLKTLEQLVKELESGNLDLDKGLEVYERATVLRDRCKKILDEADRRVQKLIETSEGTKKEDLVID
ncbi:MAG: exodeoxyribonuclease VII small subunit [Candidatus Methanoplasma sp.]|jgi:exodeoxyribonuclease VII small subunit|nr:exodeoxyribonuclease VII small subunit [Candidatus Methanoplasma sp.]